MRFSRPRVAAFAALTLVPALIASAHTVSSVAPDRGTIGDTLTVSGEGFAAGKGKPKVSLVLVDDAAPKKAKKAPTIKLKVGEFDDGSIAAQIKSVNAKKTPAGVYDLVVQVKGETDVVTPDAFTLKGPTPTDVTPETAAPGAVVTVSVQDYGSLGKHNALIGTTKSKIRAARDLGAGSWEVDLEVPRVPSGKVPVTIENSVGKGVLKNALEITGGTPAPSGFRAELQIEGLKPFKADPKRIAIDQQPGPETNIGAIGGSKSKLTVLGVSIPVTIDELTVGAEYSGDDVLVLYSLLGKNGTDPECVYSSTANREGEDVSVSIMAIDDESVTLFVCGKLRRGLGGDSKCPECITVFGTVVSPIVPEEEEPGDLCTPLTTATGSLTGVFTSSPENNVGLAGTQGPGTFQFTVGTPDNTQGFPDATLQWTITFTPLVDTVPKTFTGLSVGNPGSALNQFSLVYSGTSVSYMMNVVPETFATSMSVTITKVEPVSQNAEKIRACIHGTFTGTVTNFGDPSLPTQTLTGTFEIPWYDF